MSEYAALWCKSNFSFLEGASHPEELVASASELGLAALALTDRDGVHGAVRAHVKARELGVALVLGSEITALDGSTIVLLAADRAVAVALDAIQALGGNGYINDYPTGRLLRDAKLYDIGAGTQEIRRMLIGRELIGADS